MYRRTLRAAAVLAAALAGLGQSSGQVSIATALDRYQRGDFEAAVGGTAARDPKHVASEFIAEEPGWSSRVPSAIQARRLTAATFILEVTEARYERDARSWLPLRDAVEWSCTQLRLTQAVVPGRLDGAPPPGERVWFQASIALAQRARDSLWLVGVASPRGPVSPRHLTHTRERFPGDIRLKLAAVITTTNAVDADLDGPVRRMQLALTRTLLAMPTAATQVRPALPTTDSAVASFSPLLTSPDVGGEAELHVAHLYLTGHNYDAALDHSRLAIQAPGDAPMRYTAHIVAAQALERLGRFDEAIGEYENALARLPDGQSAVLGLAARLVAKGEQARALSLMERSLATRPADDDPWRLYYYGDFVHWPGYIKELHEVIR